MLIFDHRKIGNNLLAARKRCGMTQSEVSEAAGISDRTYADIERGTVNMRVETLLRICNVLHITPNDILTERTIPRSQDQESLLHRIQSCHPKEKETALLLLSVYLDSL